MAGRRVKARRKRVAASAAVAAFLLPAPAALAQRGYQPRFVTSGQCIACHSNMVDASGETLSIGHTWRGSLMAQSARDPYWQAAVRREIADRPELQKDIEDVCSVCHMPMFRTRAVADGRSGEIVRYLEGAFSAAEQMLAADGASCTVCHQISAENLGEHASFDGGYVIEPSLPERGTVYGPYEVAAGARRIMRSASAFSPAAGPHVQRSELCATCHTLFTPAVDERGEILGEFPEQVPYLEWKHSAFEGSQSCQDCHMPEVGVPVPISSVMGEPRQNVSRHVFRGGNAFMLQLLDRYRDELGVTAPAADLQRSIEATLEHLQSSAARVEVAAADVSGSEALLEIEVANLAGHKLPTAYPSRRAWLHLTVHGADGRTIFESGALAADGSIAGNDNDADAAAYEPHYDEISRAEQVQIYEPIIHDHKHEVTTSLLAGVTYAKDNRLLPRGFDKSTADAAVRVHGAASGDADFREGGDRVRYRVALPEDIGAIRVTAELLYQTIGYRWAQNLGTYDSFEAKRFGDYYQANAEVSAVVLATATTDPIPVGAQAESALSGRAASN